MNDKKPALLLQACCAPCTTYPYQVLSEEYDVTVYFYNPNIHPRTEYDKRLDEIREFAELWDFKLIVGAYHPDIWFRKMKGREEDREGGERCSLCYEMRLEDTARTAFENGFDAFTTALSVSPHKDAVRINRIGRALAERYTVKFLEADFKKKEGFKISCAISRELGFYRQNYCGCEFSRRDRD